MFTPFHTCGEGAWFSLFAAEVTCFLSAACLCSTLCLSRHTPTHRQTLTSRWPLLFSSKMHVKLPPVAFGQRSEERDTGVTCSIHVCFYLWSVCCLLVCRWQFGFYILDVVFKTQLLLYAVSDFTWVIHIFTYTLSVLYSDHLCGYSPCLAFFWNERKRRCALPTCCLHVFFFSYLQLQNRLLQILQTEKNIRKKTIKNPQN